MDVAENRDFRKGGSGTELPFPGANFFSSSLIVK